MKRKQNSTYSYETDKDIYSNSKRGQHSKHAKKGKKEPNVEEIKERYMSIAKGKIPDNIEEIKIVEDKMNICELLVEIGFASSKNEARRMIQGNGVKINSVVMADFTESIEIGNGIVVQFGKNRFKKIIKG